MWTSPRFLRRTEIRNTDGIQSSKLIQDVVIHHSICSKLFSALMFCSDGIIYWHTFHCDELYNSTLKKILMEHLFQIVHLRHWPKIATLPLWKTSQKRRSFPVHSFTFFCRAGGRVARTFSMAYSGLVARNYWTFSLFAEARNHTGTISWIVVFVHRICWHPHSPLCRYMSD